MENFIRNNIITVGAGLASASGLASALASPYVCPYVCPGPCICPYTYCYVCPNRIFITIFGQTHIVGRRTLGQTQGLPLPNFYYHFWANARIDPHTFVSPFLGRRILGRTHIGGRRTLGQTHIGADAHWGGRTLGRTHIGADAHWGQTQGLPQPNFYYRFWGKRKN